MSKGKDEAFEKAYASVVENGWANVKHMARQVWDLASATPPAAQVQGEQPEVVALRAEAANLKDLLRYFDEHGATQAWVMRYKQALEGAALSAPPAAGWTRAEQHDDISGDFQGYCWIDGRTGQRHWLPHGMNPNEKEPTRTNGGPHRCLFAPEGWACIKQAQHEGPCMAVKLTEGECHATSPAAGVPDKTLRILSELQWHWRDKPMGFYCPECDGEREQGHQEDCALAALLAAAPTPPASEQQQAVVMPELTEQEREDLDEFYEAVCCDAGHRVSKQGMKRLAEIGAVESVGFGKHRLTEFGTYLLGITPHLQPAATSQGE